MKPPRIAWLVTVLAILVSACGDDLAFPGAPTATPDTTATPTPSPTPGP